MSGLGPDDAPCNNTVDMFEVMKFASLGQKARLLDASRLPSDQVIRMATINGARALGLEKEIGSLEAEEGRSNHNKSGSSQTDSGYFRKVHEFARAYSLLRARGGRRQRSD